MLGSVAVDSDHPPAERSTKKIYARPEVPQYAHPESYLALLAIRTAEGPAVKDLAAWPKARWTEILKAQYPGAQYDRRILRALRDNFLDRCNGQNRPFKCYYKYAIHPIPVWKLFCYHCGFKPDVYHLFEPRNYSIVGHFLDSLDSKHWLREDPILYSSLQRSIRLLTGFLEGFITRSHETVLLRASRYLGPEYAVDVTALADTAFEAAWWDEYGVLEEGGETEEAKRIRRDATPGHSIPRCLAVMLIHLLTDPCLVDYFPSILEPNFCISLLTHAYRLQIGEKSRIGVINRSLRLDCEVDNILPRFKVGQSYSYNAHLTLYRPLCLPKSLWQLGILWRAWLMVDFQTFCTALYHYREA